MSEPAPIYTIPQAEARAKLAEWRVLINKLQQLESELLEMRAIKRPLVITRRMLHDDRRVGCHPRRIDIT